MCTRARIALSWAELVQPCLAELEDAQSVRMRTVLARALSQDRQVSSKLEAAIADEQQVRRAVEALAGHNVLA